MTQRVHTKEPETTLGASAAIDVPGRDVGPGRGGLLELLGLTLVAAAGVLFVVRPEFYENARWGPPEPLPMDAAPEPLDDMSSAVLRNAFLPASSRDKP